MKKIVSLTLFVIGMLFLCVYPVSCSSAWREDILNASLYDVDLAKTEDGVYIGVQVYRNDLYRVRVTVTNHQITAIEMLQWEPNDARTLALAIFDRVIAQQTLCVDAISGATTASKLYLLCIEDSVPYHTELCPAWE